MPRRLLGATGWPWLWRFISLARVRNKSQFDIRLVRQRDVGAGRGRQLVQVVIADTVSRAESTRMHLPDYAP